jgi:predicted carbohydrate-binding protein with CBM48
MADHGNLPRTIAALRREVPMRPEWRSAVLRDIRTLPRLAAPAPTPSLAMRRRLWALRPPAAIAAGLLCAVLGGAVVLGIEHRRTTSSVLQPPVMAGANARGERAIRFVLAAPAASRVLIVGDFNGWSPTATPMRRTPAGLWSLDIPLPAGRHTYAFVVDGVLVPDPNALGSADDDFGVPSSIVVVSEHKST